MEQIPQTIKKLIMTKHSNLQPKCINGMDKLVNLECLMIDMDPFDFRIFEYAEHNDNENIVILPIPPMPN